jgi:hypothetical protein
MSCFPLVRSFRGWAIAGALVMGASFAAGCSEPDPLGKSAADAKPATIIGPAPGDDKGAPNTPPPKGGREFVKSIKQPRPNP